MNPRMEKITNPARILVPLFVRANIMESLEGKGA
jgi:hypothetical protein